MKIGLALSGGGARGLAHLKILEAFDELNIKPNIIAGSSIGAFIGALYAAGISSKEIQKFFKGINFQRFAQLFDISFTGKGLIKGIKVENIFSQLIDTENFEDLEIPLKVIATDLESRKEKVFSKGNITKAVRASISIPGIFEPVEIDSKVYVDGGLTNLIPTNHLKNCDLVIAINVGEEKPNLNKLKMVDLLSASFSLVQNKYAKELMKQNPPDHLINAKLEEFNMMDFQKHKAILEKSDKYRLKTKKILQQYINKNT